jgi:uncharacterized protein (TIGR02996 family)
MSEALRLALEAAIFENPDDLAAHMAYGDLLAEQGDPRGELIQVQLALEDASRSASERKGLQLRERALFAAHVGKWLGGLPASFLDFVRQEDGTLEIRRLASDGFRFVIQRGWLRRLVVVSYGGKLFPALRQGPAVPLLSELLFQNHEGFRPSAAASAPVRDWLAGPPLGPRLHFFAAAGLTTEVVVSLMRSAHLRGVTRLDLPRSNVGDAGIAALIEAGLLRHLRELNLLYCRITNVMAGLLAAAPDFRNVEQMWVSRDMLFSEALPTLRATGVKVKVATTPSEPRSRFQDEGDLFDEITE